MNTLNSHITPPHNLLGFCSRLLVSLAFVIGSSITTSGCIAPLIAPAIQGALASGKASKAQAAKDAKNKKQLTQLEIRQLQTRTYDNDDTKRILQVALAVLQDDGFAVQNANVDLGLLSASKSLSETTVDDSGTAFAKGFFGGGFASVSSQEFSTIEATATVTPHGKQTRVRLSARLSSVGIGLGANINYEAITDPDFYQAFFTKLEKGLFIQQENL